MRYILGISLLAFSSLSFASSGIVCKDGECKNEATKSLWGITFTPSYKSLYEIEALHVKHSCENEGLSDESKLPLPKDTRFRQTLDREAQTDNEMLVHVYTVKGMDETNSSTNSVSSIEEKYFSNPFRLCLKGKHSVPKSSFKRIGGINTGLLVVPFKLRNGDIFSDSTIGPYISYKWAVVEGLFTTGLSQISISQVGTSDIESRSGLTVALGINVEIDKNWDIAFLVGSDHLSGETGDNWEYQDKIWTSFAIGFNFTRKQPGS